MRQRNVKNKREIIKNSKYVVINPFDNINRWDEVFKNNNPIHIEIGMGKGNFILKNAITNPNINFIGIEKSDSILSLALKKIDLYNLDNLKVFRIDAIKINEIFNHEIEKLYLNFSDPWPKKRHARRRLTSSEFLLKYDDIFKNRSVIQFKTDNRGLFEYSLISLNDYGYKIKDISLNLHNSNIDNNIMTEYEEKFSKMGNVIYYVIFEK